MAVAVVRGRSGTCRSPPPSSSSRRCLRGKHRPPKAHLHQLGAATIIIAKAVPPWPSPSSQGAPAPAGRRRRPNYPGDASVAVADGPDAPAPAGRRPVTMITAVPPWQSPRDAPNPAGRHHHRNHQGDASVAVAVVTRRTGACRLSPQTSQPSRQCLLGHRQRPRRTSTRWSPTPS